MKGMFSEFYYHNTLRSDRSPISTELLVTNNVSSEGQSFNCFKGSSVSKYDMD